MSNPQLLSNSFDDFVAGGALYPGGAGVIADIKYRLWDYEGKQAPDSACAVYVQFQPTDGSNDGKPVDIFWSVGQSHDYQPDHTGGFIISQTKAGITDSCNWGFVMSKFKNTCGLEGAKINQPGVGLRALIGSELTLVRVDQPKRENLDSRPPEPGQQPGNKFKPTILIPTRLRGAWEMRGGASMGIPQATAPVLQMPTQNPYMQTQGQNPAAPVQPMAPAAVNPYTQQQPVYAPPPVQSMAPMAPVATTAAPTGPFDLGQALHAILNEAGGAIGIADLPKAMLNKVVSISTGDRLNVMAAIGAQNLMGIAPQFGLRFDGAILTR